MTRAPRISIVTSSYNQGTFIARTIDSVLAQDYPDVEHIVVDGMSTDATADVLATYSHLKVIREPDGGQADAINKGFRIATGQIFGFLNSDDTLEPGALSCVADALAPGSSRHIVMGRCRFIDEHDQFVGVEHPSAFEGHRRVLEIWKGHWLPQPAIFWMREVWETCGPLREDERLMLDYDLFCRFSRRYPFYQVDRVLASYRLHAESKTTSITDAERLEQAIAVSRRYWGSPAGLQYWQVLASYAVFRLNRRARAAHLMRGARDLYRDGRYGPALVKLLAGGALAPDVAADVAVPILRPALRKARRLARLGRRSHPQTDAWRDHTSLHSDGWAGPTLVQRLQIGPGASALVLVGTVPFGRMPRPLDLESFVDGRSLGRRRAGRRGQFSVAWSLAAVEPGSHELRITASGFLIPHDHQGNGDHRPLSYRVIRLEAGRGSDGAS